MARLFKFYGEEFYHIEGYERAVAGQKFQVHLFCSRDVFQDVKQWMDFMLGRQKLALEVLGKIIEHNGPYPCREFPTRMLYFLFHESDFETEASIHSSPDTKSSNNKYERILIKINIGPGLYHGTKIRASFRTLMVHELLHAVSSAHERQDWMKGKLTQHCEALLKKEGKDEDQWYKEYWETSVKLCRKCGYRDDKAYDFYRDYLLIGERLRRNAWNTFADSALGVIALRLRAFSFVEETIAFDRRRFEHAKQIIGRIIGLKKDLKTKGEKFVTDASNVLAYFSALHTMPVHTAALSLLIQNHGYVANALTLNASEQARLKQIYAEMSSLNQEGTNIRHGLYSFCDVKKVHDYFFEFIVKFNTAMARIAKDDLLTKDVVKNKDIDKTIFHEGNIKEMKMAQEVYFRHLKELLDALRQHL